MKTYYLLSRRLPLFSVIGMMAMMVASCGSYQNSSYYDNDGVYGNSENKNRETVSNDNSQSSKYQEYFSDLNKESEAFTNIDNYSSVSNDTVARTTENYNDNNSSWGSNPQSVTINVYDNNWGYGYWNNYWYGNYWGWNNWYGPSWGWGWNSWYGPGWNVGWGWGGWGGWYSPWYGGYYGYNNWYGGNFYHTHYNGGRRGGYYNSYAANRMNSSRYDVRNNAPHTYNSIRGGNNIGTRSSTFNPTRSNSTFNPTRSNSSNPVRTTTSPTRSNINSSPRPNSSNSQPTRSNVRTESSSPRSYTPSSSYGGGRSSGGGGGSYGGGRSGGGGGRR